MISDNTKDSLGEEIARMGIESTLLKAYITNLEEKVKELLEEQNWLRKRAKRAGSFGLIVEREDGISANAMVEYALGAEEPKRSEYPRDVYDLNACVRCRNGAPEHLRPKMDSIIAKYKSVLEVTRA